MFGLKHVRASPTAAACTSEYTPSPSVRPFGLFVVQHLEVSRVRLYAAEVQVGVLQRTVEEELLTVVHVHALEPLRPADVPVCLRADGSTGRSGVRPHALCSAPSPTKRRMHQHGRSPSSKLGQVGPFAGWCNHASGQNRTSFVRANDTGAGNAAAQQQSGHIASATSQTHLCPVAARWPLLS